MSKYGYIVLSPCTQILTTSKSLLRAFLTMLETYEIVPESEKTLHGKQATSTNDPAKRRELKLNQWKKEKELKTRIEVSSPLSDPDVPLSLTTCSRFSGNVVANPLTSQPKQISIKSHLCSHQALKKRPKRTTQTPVLTKSYAKRHLCFCVSISQELRTNSTASNKSWSYCEVCLRRRLLNQPRTIPGWARRKNRTICGS